MISRELTIYDPAMCCSTGVCGPELDVSLVRFAADLEWIAKQGTRVRRFNLAQEPDAFARAHHVRKALQDDGEKALPLIVVNGQVVSRGRYPSRSELAGWSGLSEEATPEVQGAIAEMNMGEAPGAGLGVSGGCCGGIKPDTDAAAEPRSGCC